MTDKKKHAGGRPTKYKEEFVGQVYKLCVLGAKDAEIADFFGVCIDTITNWKQEYSEFFASIKKGKEEFDVKRVEGALIHRAIGYDHEEEKVFCNMGKITTHQTVKHYPPDTTALIFWLKNRNPAKWRDKQEVDHTTKGESLNDAPTETAIERAKDRILQKINENA